MTRRLRAQLKANGLGVQSTLEVFSAVILQILSTGAAKAPDLEELRDRFSLPSIPDPPAEKRLLPTDDQIRESASFEVMKHIISNATNTDFREARAAAIAIEGVLNSPTAREVFVGYGLGELLDIVLAIQDDELPAMALLPPLILRVGFGINTGPVAELVFTPKVAEEIRKSGSYR
jgi:hypothetical protein